MAQLKDDSTAHRFEMEEDGRTVFATYRRTADTLFIDHVETPPALRGAGAAGRLMEAVTAQARAEGRKIHPICGYAAAWLARRPEHADLIAREARR